ncbi:hypothetical protein D3C86_1416910 [compost metagenome]
MSLAARRLIRSTGIHRDPNFKEDFRLDVPIRSRVRTTAGLKDTFKFDYAYRNGSLEGLYEELQWGDEDNFTTKADSIAWMMDNVLEAGLITPDKCGVLVGLTPEQLDAPVVGRSLRILRSFTEVYNLADPQESEAIKGRFRDLVAAHQPAQPDQQ